MPGVILKSFLKLAILNLDIIYLAMQIWFSTINNRLKNIVENTWKSRENWSANPVGRCLLPVITLLSLACHIRGIERSQTRRFEKLIRLIIVDS